MTTTMRTTLRTGTYTIDTERSTCRLTATHVFGLKPVRATMDLRGGTITVAGDLAASSASAELDASSFHSDDPRRDRDISGKHFLRAAEHPVIAFRSTACRRTVAGWRLDGVLRVRGRDSDVSLTLDRAEPAGDGCHFVATGIVDRLAAGVTTGRAIIARPVEIRLDLFAF